jgi:type III restriction enzyme
MWKRNNLDEHAQLLWWFRNRVRKDFHIQGWQRHKIYPDFIAAKPDKTDSDLYDTVYVLEPKGVHLKANDDTIFKQNIFALCNELCNKREWKDLFKEFPNQDFEFQVVFENEWQDKINQLLQ